MGREVIRAFVLAGVYGVWLIFATPGVDGLPSGFLRTEKSFEKLAEKVPRPAVSMLKGISDLNRDYRKPLVKWLTPLQRPLRIEQTWRLYGDGPSSVHRVEIEVDGTVIYRTGDADLDWEDGTWLFRRLRPVPATVVARCRKKNQPVNRVGLSRLVMERALEDFPDAQRVEMRVLAGAFPGDDLKPTHALLRQAPEWAHEDVHYGEGPCR
jgi:hypothetical protein